MRPARSFLAARENSVAENVAKARLRIITYPFRISSTLWRNRLLRPAASLCWSIWPFELSELCRPEHIVHAALRCRAGLNEREAPGKIVTARPTERPAQLSSVSHAFVSTLQKHWLKKRKIWYDLAVYSSEAIGGDVIMYGCSCVVNSLIRSNMQWWDCTSLISAPLTAEEGCETGQRIVLL